MLSDGDKADIQKAMSELDKDKNIQLWVVYTKTFDGQTGQQWAEQHAASCPGSAAAT